MVDEGIEWDIDANLPMYTRDYLKMVKQEDKERIRLILAESFNAALAFHRDHDFKDNHVAIVRRAQDLEGLRFRYEDVLRVPGWSKNPEIEEIEDRIHRTHIFCSPR